MHILLAILGIVAAAAFWWYRMRRVRDAATEVVDAVGRVRGNMRRQKIRKQNELSPITAIDDPVVAAATVIASIISDDVALNDAREETLRQEIDAIALPGKLDETMVYAKWAASQVDDAAVVIDKLGPMLAAKLDEPEKQSLLTMTRRVALADTEPLPMLEPRLRRLRQKLGLVVD